MEIKRSIIKELYDDFSDRRVSILVGARQVGKTYLMRRIEEEARRRGSKTAMFDLEQPSDLIAFNASEEEIFRLLTQSGDVVFIDEFHYLKNASHIFKAVYDSGLPVKIFASGSSSLEIHKHLKESLAGRKALHRIHPCSSQEVLSTGQKFTIGYYLVFGGMPGLVHHDDDAAKKALLQDILQSYVIKDIKSLIREENIRAFNNLLYLLAENQGSLISADALSREVGLTARTVESYLEIMNQTYVLHSIASYSTNLGNELKKSRKCYLYDLGIRNMLLKDFRGVEARPDAGVVIESFVFLELVKQMLPESEIRFWRTKSGDEVDFVWIEDRIPYPIEVKAGDCAGRVPDGLKAFLKRYRSAKKGFVLHGGGTADKDVDGVNIHFRPWADASKIPSEIGTSRASTIPGV